MNVFIIFFKSYLIIATIISTQIFGGLDLTTIISDDVIVSSSNSNRIINSYDLFCHSRRNSDIQLIAEETIIDGGLCIETMNADIAENPAIQVFLIIIRQQDLEHGNQHLIVI